MEPRSILVVDDHATTRRLVRVALEQGGFTVLEARDGKSALELMQRERPALVIQDLVLPDVDGFVLASRLRALAGTTHPVRLLACSGLVSNLDVKRIASVGFDDLIAKPISPGRLLELVRTHVAQLEPAHDAFGAGRRLLLVDDDPVQIRLTSFRLARLGFEVTEARDGEHALELARATPPDLIVSDVLMPRLDGFGLAVALRRDPQLASVPLVLVTSSFLEAGDRELGRRAGADEFVLRGPDLSELSLALRSVLARGKRRVAQPTAPDAELEREHQRIMLRQLERQLVHGSELMRRSSQLSAELSIVTSLSEAVLKHHDVESALITALATCFDAGNSSFGALYLLDRHGQLRVRSLGLSRSGDEVELSTFFGQEAWLRTLMDGGELVVIAPYDAGAAPTRVLERAQAQRALVVPLVHVDRPLGALFMAVRKDDRAVELEPWRLFAQGVANQITQALALAEAFREREVAEREAEQQRRLAREQAAVWRALVEHAPDTVIQLDTTGRVRFINRPPRDFAKRGGDATWFDLMPPECHESMRAALAAVLSSGSAERLELSRCEADGSVSWIESHLGPVRTGHEIVGVLVIQRDVSLKKQTEVQLIIADRMASVGTMAAGVAHEINNPLASVIANLDLALHEVESLGDAVSSELREELRDACEGAERVRRIVRDLKIFSRADEDTRKPVDVARVVDSALRMAWNELRFRAQLIKDYRAVPPVEASEARLGQVFLNLVVNAAQSIPEGAADRNEIRVRIGKRDGFVVVTVADTGCGMGPGQRARLFTPFFTTKPVGVGTGLGLSICHRIVSSMGGRITVETELGSGSAFHVWLPPSRAERPSTVETKGPVIEAKRRGRVLVIDDEQLITQVVRRTLTKEHDVTELACAADALALFQEGARFDVIVCDLMMPQMTGMDFHEELARTYPDQAARVVFFTGGAFTRRAKDFLEHVPNQHVEKPLDGHELRALVNEMVR